MRCMFILPLVLGALRAQLVSRTAIAAEMQMTAPAFDKVLTMLQNLVQQLDSESTADEADYEAFLGWFEEQEKSTSATVTALTAKLQELGAALTDLRARQQTLGSEVHDLNVELDRETGTLQEAQEKRQGEHDAFVKEQLDFDNAIAACNKAAELLTNHFGDGSPKESTKPAWMSLSSVFHTIAKIGHKHGRSVPAMIQQPANFFNADGSSLHNTYQEKTGEAVNIVAEVQALAQTFAEDKTSSEEQEKDLQSAFDTLSAQKSAIIASITGQRDTQQGVLNQVNQQVAEHDSAQQIAEQTLQHEQAYLTSLATQQKDTTDLYERRKKDRADEKAAVQQAHTILQEQAPALLQLKHSHKRRVFIQTKVRTEHPGCKGCSKAAALLRSRAVKYHSELLATTAATLSRKNDAPPAAPALTTTLSDSAITVADGLHETGSAAAPPMASASQSSALEPVVSELEGLVVRLDQEADAEKKHKEWCEHERTESVSKRDRHSTLVSQLEKQITDTQGVIGDKQLALQDNQDSTARADSDFADLSNLRSKAKSDFEAELQDYSDAITALNQASTMLTEFYQSGGALLQTRVVRRQAPTVPEASDKAAAPTMGSLSGEFENKGGPAGVLNILAETRQEFDAGKAALEESERQQDAEFQSSEAAYKDARDSLVQAANQLTVEMQTAEQSLAADQQNLASNEAEVTAAKQYLSQVGASCDSLEAHFDDRQSLRGQERQALNDAIDVLKTS
jgi:hypothetical protein